MDSELESKIKEIGGMFGIDNIPDNIGDIVTSFLNSRSDISDDSCVNDEGNSKSDACDKCDSEASPDMLKIISTISNMRHSTQDDYKINFLQALKPLLGRDKHKKVDTCVNLLYFTKIAEQYRKIK